MSDFKVGDIVTPISDSACLHMTKIQVTPPYMVTSISGKFLRINHKSNGYADTAFVILSQEHFDEGLFQI